MNRSRTVVLALALSGLLLAALPSLAAARVAYFTANEGGSKPFAAPVNLVTHAVGGESVFGTSAEGSPEDVAITPDGSTAYVTNGAANPNGVVPIDVATNTAKTQIPVANPDAIAIAPNGAFAYVTSSSSNQVFKIDLAANTVVGTLTFGDQLFGIAITPDGKTAFVVSNLDQSVYPINLSTFEVGSPIALGATAFPTSIAITPNGASAYVLSPGLETLSRIDIASETVTATISNVPGVELAISPNGERAYTIVSNELKVVNLSTGEVGPPISSSEASFEDLAILPDGSRGFIAGYEGNTFLGALTPFDTSSSSLEPAFPLSGFGARAIAIVPNQPPHAAFTASPSTAKVGQSFAFDGSGSTDSDGSVARYDWEFGDGSSAANGGAKPSHSYAKAGTYTVTLTTTDNEGCSTALVFTGQTAYCNGSSVARTTRQVTVGACATVKGSASSFVPKFRSHHVVPGVRVRLATSAPARLDVTATLLWSKDGGGSAGLGKVSAVVKHWRRIRFPIPANLRDELPLGTPVKVKLTIASHPLEDGCSGAVTHRTLKVKVVKVIEAAVQFMRAF
jgi:DNA-binding beta-propeller fold protein YncE